jgi:hypothetical protein
VNIVSQNFNLVCTDTERTEFRRLQCTHYYRILMCHILRDSRRTVDDNSVYNDTTEYNEKYCETLDLM